MWAVYLNVHDFLRSFHYRHTFERTNVFIHWKVNKNESLSCAPLALRPLAALSIKVLISSVWDAFLFYFPSIRHACVLCKQVAWLHLILTHSRGSVSIWQFRPVAMNYTVCSTKIRSCLPLHWNVAKETKKYRFHWMLPSILSLRCHPQQNRGHA